MGLTSDPSEPVDSHAMADKWLVEAGRQFENKDWNAARAAAAIARAWAVVGASMINEP